MLALGCGSGESETTPAPAASEAVTPAADTDDDANGEADPGLPADDGAATDDAAPDGEGTLESAGLEHQGTLTLKEYSVAFIGSGSMGKGTLQVGDQTRGFRLGGLGIGGIGVSAINATGNVYNLPDIEAFPGAYGKARIGATIADKGKGRLWLKNPNGVVIELWTTMEGLALTGGVDGIVITWEANYQEGVQDVKDGTQKAWDSTKSGTRKAADAIKKPFQ
jgi:hypothetical protein